MNLELFGVPWQTIASAAGAAIFAAVGGTEAWKHAGPVLSRFLAVLKSKSAKTSAAVPVPDSVPVEILDPEAEIANGLYLAARYAKELGRHDLSEAVLDGLFELLKVPDEGAK